MNSFDRFRNGIDLNSGSFRTIDDNCDLSSINSSYDVYEGEMIRRSSERDKVEYYAQDPLELLRRLDELKDQINRSSRVNENPSYPSQIPLDLASSSSTSSSSSYMYRREMGMHRFYPSSLSNSYVPPPFQTRGEGGLSSEVVGFSRKGHKIPSGRSCYPIAGGSPFVTCYNCSELLEVPRKVLFLEKKLKKMQCGACLTVLLLEIVNKKLIVSVSELPQISNEAVGDSLLPPPHQTVNQGSSLVSGHMIQDESLKLSSDDSGHDFQDINREPVTSSSIHNFNTGKSASPHSSMDEDNTHEKSDDFAEIIPITVNSPPPPPPPPKRSSLQDCFDYSNIYRKVDQFDKGNQSKSSENDLGMPKKAFLQEDSMKDASLATEIDVSFQYSISVTSQESGDASIEGRSMDNKGHQQSLLPAGIKKQESSLSDQDTISNVTVNGIHIPDHLVKKAEKCAGPIKPGNYWYDFQAGFWGGMGGPCLGIILPFIDELNYPMVENCAGGETAVFVNGRELHQKDLDTLCKRGLPSAKNRSYEIEISGRVFDGISGERLKGLGRLAPTVEKAKRGFGMKPPRKAAA